MFSSCVIYCDNFNKREWTKQEYETLLFYHYKFDLYTCSGPMIGKVDNWLSGRLLVRRVVADLTERADVKGFFSVEPQKEEWIGNFDIYIDFPIQIRQRIEAQIPNRYFVTMEEAGR